MTQRRKVSWDVYAQWAREYDRNDYYDGYEGMRFGQAFINHFHETGDSLHPELFYTVDRQEAINIILDEYIDYS